MVSMYFDRLLKESAQAAQVQQRKLCASLPNKADGYGCLRDVQGQALSEWHARRDERDLITKVTTGAGRTIDGADRVGDTFSNTSFRCSVFWPQGLP